jgi:hypothetical protein
MGRNRTEWDGRMRNDTQQIVNKAWNFAHVLRDDGLSYMAYTGQIAFFLGSSDICVRAAHRHGLDPADRVGWVFRRLAENRNHRIIYASCVFPPDSHPREGVWQVRSRTRREKGG